MHRRSGTTTTTGRRSPTRVATIAALAALAALLIASACSDDGTELGTGDVATSTGEPTDGQAPAGSPDVGASAEFCDAVDEAAVELATTAETFEDADDSGVGFVRIAQLQVQAWQGLTGVAPPEPATQLEIVLGVADGDWVDADPQELVPPPDASNEELNAWVEPDMGGLWGSDGIAPVATDAFRALNTWTADECGFVPGDLFFGMEQDMQGP